MRKILSVLLVLCICFVFLPVSVFAAEQGELLERVPISEESDILDKVSFTMSLTLQDCTKINLKVNNTGTQEYQYRYSFLDKTYETQKLPAGETKTVSVPCASTQYREPLTVEVYYEYGGEKVKVAEKSVSVQDYCLSTIRDTTSSDKLTALCKSVLEYGYYAQQEFKYRVERAPGLENTDNKVSSDVSNIDGFPITWGGTVLSSVESYTASLELENYTELNIRIHMTDTTHTLKNVSVSALDGEGVTSSLTKDSDTVYKLHIAKTPFAELDRVYRIQITDETDQTEEVQLSPMSYVQLAKDGEQKNILRALYLYYLNAKDYFQKETAN